MYTKSPPTGLDIYVGGWAGLVMHGECSTGRCSQVLYDLIIYEQARLKGVTPMLGE